MSIITHEVRLHSNEAFGKRLPPHHLGYLLSELPTAVQQSISMGLRNRSVGRGGRPKWLRRASDIRFVGHGGNGSSVLYFEAPTLSESASEVYQQPLLFDARPSGEDTGFDLLGDVLADVAARNSDSDHFDQPLLNRLIRFSKVFRRGPFREVDFTSRRHVSDHPARLNSDVVQAAQQLLGTTPAPHRVRLVGQLDGLEASTQRFSLLLDTGEKVVGVFADELIDTINHLWRRRVLVHGKAVYRASGRLLRIDAELISLGENEPSLWSRLPQPGRGKLDASKLHKPQGPRSGMAAILGRWPGDESNAEILAALEKLS